MGGLVRHILAFDSIGTSAANVNRPRSSRSVDLLLAKSEPMRFAILGLYNSGSSAIAGMLHRLGANLGPPFWRQRPGRESTVYEADDLGAALRRWWDEPELIERATCDERIGWLRAWIERQESIRSAPAGAKHPLLALTARDVVAAWGADTRFIWARRSLAESIAGLTRRGWFPGREPAMQLRLWGAIDAFVGSGHAVTAIDWEETQRDPAAAAMRLAALVDLEPDDDQVAAAASLVRGPAA